MQLIMGNSIVLPLPPSSLLRKVGEVHHTYCKLASSLVEGTPYPATLQCKIKQFDTCIMNWRFVPNCKGGLGSCPQIITENTKEIDLHP